MPQLVPPVVLPEALSGAEVPVLPADGLVLRPWREQDAPAVQQAFTDPEIQRWNLRSFDDDAEAVQWMAVWRERWQHGSGGCWAVTAPSGTTGAGSAGDTVLGCVGVLLDLPRGAGELSYWVAPYGRGQRATSRAVTALVRWAEELGLHRLWLEHSTANAASCAVAERAGLALEGTLRSQLLHTDGWHDMHVHARLLSEPSA